MCSFPIFTCAAPFATGRSKSKFGERDTPVATAADELTGTQDNGELSLPAIYDGGFIPADDIQEDENQQQPPQPYRLRRLHQATTAAKSSKTKSKAETLDGAANNTETEDAKGKGKNKRQVILSNATCAMH